MYRETDAVTAFMQYKLGGHGIMLHENGEIWPMAEAFKQFDNARFVVDFPEEKKEPEKAVVVPKAETPEKQPDRMGKRSREEMMTEEQRVLKAWNGGERTIQQIMELTGYSRYIVRKYIPINEKG